KRNPGYWRKKNPPPQEPLQDLCTTQVAQDEEVKSIEISDALQDVLVMQPAVMVGLISMMTGSALQEDIAATTRALLSKGQDILGRRLWSLNDALPRCKPNRYFVRNGCALCRTVLVGSINGWCAMATSLGVVLKRWPFTCYWSRWPMRRA